MLGSLSTYGDSSYKEEDLITGFNSSLANNYGNLVNRLIHLAGKTEVNISQSEKCTENFMDLVSAIVKDTETAYESFQVGEAVKHLGRLLGLGNQYFHDSEPWKKDNQECEIILNNIAYLLRKTTDLYEPIIPEGALRVRNCLDTQEKQILFPKIETL